MDRFPKLPMSFLEAREMIEKDQKACDLAERIALACGISKQAVLDDIAHVIVAFTKPLNECLREELP